MSIDTVFDTDALVTRIQRELEDGHLAEVSALVADVPTPVLVSITERLSTNDGAVMYRLLPKDTALEVFESLAPALQGDLLHAFQDRDVTSTFLDMDPDDRVWLLDELPAALASRLLRGLPADERRMTAAVLGYPQDSVGRRMSPEYVTTHPRLTVAETLERISRQLDDAETVYTIPVLDRGRRVVGVVSMRDLLRGPGTARIEDIMRDAHTVEATVDEEEAARRATSLRVLALPVVDSEGRLVGILTLDDAIKILEREEAEDSARQGGSEPLARPYLSASIRSIVRSRVVWLLVLAIGATLTVQVLEVFEDTLEQVTVLALFVPLLIGTGGNTGNQAATTVTRALSLGDVRPRDVLKVLLRELRVGFLLGLLLGSLGFAITALIYAPQIGLVIGLTLLSVCTVAASIGGVMPILARAVRVDPAVFSNPFITTFVDATGLIIYFLIARAVLGL
ncbi:MAG: magnesium transporter [Brachybacterium sp.]|nr:magnesium transporter [Brachybacterium sp.]